MHDDPLKSPEAEPQTLHHIVSIVSAYVSHNSLRPADLPELIASVHAAVGALARSSSSTSVDRLPAGTPAVPVKKSIAKDFIVCLEDGKKFKSLRRHLSSVHGLTPEAYRAKWSLPSDYPMVAPTYSATRSQLAKESGLGQVARSAAPDAPQSDAAPKPSKRGRPKKTDS